MDKLKRTEEEIFDDLVNLCASPGFIHAISHICLRDNIVAYEGDIQPEDLQKLYSPKRLIRTEISTLIGLLIKNEIDCSSPDPAALESMVNSADDLLEEIHHALTPDIFSGLSPDDIQKKSFNPFKEASNLREPIFYSAESAYVFQYIELARKKYINDDEWFKSNKGFSNNSAYKILSALPEILNIKINHYLPIINKAKTYEEYATPIFLVSTDELKDLTGINTEEINAFLNSFSIPEDSQNEEFKSISDFNIYNSQPILKATDSFLIFQLYSLAEAYYDTPFYWFLGDKSYAPTALMHRGDFTEKFISERIDYVFNPTNVYKNLHLTDKKGNIKGEIDVLVTYADRAIIIQAKSKKLTIESRKGNDKLLQNDFKKAIQDAYDQGYSCAELIQDHEIIIVDSDFKRQKVSRTYKEIYIFCIISDHYPALAFQTSQFLAHKETDVIQSPFIMDIFNLDVMSEFLNTPLYFLSYANRRAIYAERVLASHEITILGFHIKKNLWMNDDVGMIMLHDDISADIDVAMSVRRGGSQGKHTPDGILTRFNNTTLGGLISDIQSVEYPGIIDLGFVLLHFDEETIFNVSQLLDQLINQAIQDRNNHDLTLPVPDGNTGLTFHCNYLDDNSARVLLENHTNKRKYSEKAGTWFGVCIDPDSKRSRFFIGITTPWKKSDKMDRLVADLPRPNNIKQLLKSSKKKIGRNQPCPCGSGKKYKHCCLRNTKR